jgi:hypothetical protein
LLYRVEEIVPVTLPNIEEVKKVLGPRREARLARAALRRPVSIIPPAPSRQTVESLLSKSGVNVAEFQKTADEYRIEMRKLAEQNAAKAIAQSPAIQKSLQADLAARSEAVKLLQQLATPDSSPIVLPSPFLIWQSIGVQLDNYQIQPYNNWAKLKHHATSQGSGEVTFYYFWEAPDDVDTVFTVNTVAGVHGHLEADDNTTYWLFSHQATTLDISLELSPFNWSQDSNNPLPGETEYPAELSAYGSGWPISVGAIVSQDVFRGYDLGVTDILVHPGQLMVFEVIMTMQYAMGDGSIDVDFSSGDFQVMCPYVIINITS